MNLKSDGRIEQDPIVTQLPSAPRLVIDERHDDQRRYPHGVALMDGQYLRIPRARLYDTVHVWNGKFFDIAGRNQFLLVAESKHLASPVIGAAASLHRQHSWGEPA
ncbi:hypothetical protein [Bradyrhizobium sp. Arg816]|uniref:hypothetical protein n=1 Tax=Bradyrhizobium sp. Arg816 TaxID=2998491 RepID=UPI00249E0809|nr:hypothetical protein [Bradyrhizobium sp. Arg816]MDI3567193.1 hypothetical protein [Bradyrhizobium sp. Arg816]